MPIPRSSDSSESKQESSVPIIELNACLAKTVQIDGKSCPGFNVFDHLFIVGLIAKELKNRLFNGFLEDLQIPGIELIVALHDLGKISPIFQNKIYKRISFQKCELAKELELDSANLEKNLKKIDKFAEFKLEKQWGGHAGVSRSTFIGKPEEVSGELDELHSSLELEKVSPESAEFYGYLLGYHHGYRRVYKNNRSCTYESFGGLGWYKLRLECIDRLKKKFNKEWPEISSANASETRKYFNTGLTVVADWLGSDSELFHSDSEADYVLKGAPVELWPAKIQKFLDDRGFTKLKINRNLSFADIFTFQPNSLQKDFYNSVDQPGIYILEAPMGIGKTEAALYAGYKLLQAGKARGLYFALPTQLTSEKIFERVREFVKKIADPRSSIQDPLLIHSLSWLYKHIGQDAVKESQSSGSDLSDQISWFQIGKRGILAPFACGTIDQALLSVLTCKSCYLRLFGLAGKVIIIDELHSYDVYCSTLIGLLVKSLRELKATVIILSATLSSERKKSLFSEIPELESLSFLNETYPLITTVPERSEGKSEFSSSEKIQEKSIQLELVSEDEKAIEEALSAADQGQQVLWIENIVNDAQNLFKRIQARVKGSNLKIEVGLLHSRFLRKDRNEIEKIWVKIFGKETSQTERYQSGRILIGTQILEESLDIDADLLVTRFCPTDMLIQRLGRLWRHKMNNPFRPESAKARAIVMVPSDQDNSEKKDLFSSSGLVYDKYLLFRSLEIWKSLTEISLPADIRKLINATYSERVEESKVLKELKKEQQKKQKKLRRRALQGTNQNETSPEIISSTRYSEIEYVDLLLLTDLDKNGNEMRLQFLNDSESISIERKQVKKRSGEWKSVVLKLQKNLVRVQKRLAPQPPSMEERFLEPYLYLGEDGDLVRIGIVDQSTGRIKFEDGSESEFFYDQRIGYYERKKEKEL